MRRQAALNSVLRSPTSLPKIRAAWDDRKFEQRLRFHGFNAQSDRVRARREKGGSKHTIFVGLKQARRPARGGKRRTRLVFRLIFLRLISARRW